MANDLDQLKQKALYDWENPDFAFNNALRDLGYNPYAANPIMAELRRLAPGMSISYQQRQAANPTVNPGNVSGLYGDFGSYLRNSISGGGVLDTLNSGVNNFGNTVGNIRNSLANP